jgi:hypothetical protein
MRPFAIEDQIIAYFDGGLNDSESAELLHLVSVSPEIRQMFHEHETLRTLSQSALAAVTVRPEVESRLLAHIESLAAAQHTERTLLAPLAWWSQYRLVLSGVIAAAFLGGITMYYTAKSGSHTTNAFNQSELKQNGLVVSNTTSTRGNELSAPTSDASKNTVSSITEPNSVAASQSVSSTHVSHHFIQHSNRVSHVSAANANETESDQNNLIAQNAIAENSHSDPTSNELTSSEITSSELTPISSVTPISSNTTCVLPPSGSTMNTLRQIVQANHESGPNMFEFRLETSSGFSYPASGPTVHPFADFRASLGYAITPKNFVGARLNYGLFQTLPSVTRTSSIASVVITRDLTSTRQFAEEIYFTHREASPIGELLQIDLTAGAGLIPNGSTISAELGFRLPFGDHFMGGISFSLTRVHSNAPLLQDLINSEVDGSVGNSTPIIIEGSDIRNTLNGRIQYGLSYRF